MVLTLLYTVNICIFKEIREFVYEPVKAAMSELDSWEPAPPPPPSASPSWLKAPPTMLRPCNTRTVQGTTEWIRSKRIYIFY